MLFALTPASIHGRYKEEVFLIIFQSGNGNWYGKHGGKLTYLSFDCINFLPLIKKAVLKGIPVQRSIKGPTDWNGIQNKPTAVFFCWFMI